jgi:CRP/FNR family cyclic AMP-dependent transcriptional regulator
MSDAMVDALRRADVFWGLEREDIEILAEVLPRITLEHGQYLFRQGVMGDSMYIVADGRLQVRVSDDRGQSTTVGMLGPGESVGEMACVDPSPRSAAVLATQPTTVCELSADTIETLEEVAPSIVATIVGGVMRHVTKRLRQTNERLELELRGLHRDRDPDGAVGEVGGAGAKGGPRPYRGRFPWEKAAVPEGLELRDVEMLGSAGRLLTWQPGMLLCAEGRPGASCFVLLGGHVDVFKASAGGGRHLATLGPGTLLGQMSLVDSSPRSASVRAIDEVVALEIGRDIFERLVRSATPFALRFQRQIALAGIRQLRMANSRLTGLLGKGEELEKEQKSASEQPELSRVQTALYEWTVSIED